MSGTFLELVERAAGLRRKLEVYEQIKDYVEGLDIDKSLRNDVLLDLDEFCVGPLSVELNKIENAKLTRPKKKATKTTEKKDGKAKTAKERGKKEAKGKTRKRKAGKR
jgi:hypothetical protein